MPAAVVDIVPPYMFFLSFSTMFDRLAARAQDAAASARANLELALSKLQDLEQEVVMLRVMTSFCFWLLFSNHLNVVVVWVQAVKLVGSQPMHEKVLRGAMWS